MAYWFGLSLGNTVHLLCLHLNQTNSAETLERNPVGAKKREKISSGGAVTETIPEGGGRQKTHKEKLLQRAAYLFQGVLQDLINSCAKLFCLLPELGRGTHLEEFSKKGRYLYVSQLKTNVMSQYYPFSHLICSLYCFDEL